MNNLFHFIFENWQNLSLKILDLLAWVGPAPIHDKKRLRQAATRHANGHPPAQDAEIELDQIHTIAAAREFLAGR